MAEARDDVEGLAAELLRAAEGADEAREAGEHAPPGHLYRRAAAALLAERDARVEAEKWWKGVAEMNATSGAFTARQLASCETRLTAAEADLAVAKGALERMVGAFGRYWRGHEQREALDEARTALAPLESPRLEAEHLRRKKP